MAAFEIGSLDEEPIDVAEILSEAPYLRIPEQQTEILFKCKQLSSKQTF